MAKSFADYRATAADWITLASGDFYPDVLVEAVRLYQPVLEWFGQLVRQSESSERLLLEIAGVREGWLRIQLMRVFKRYVSPNLPVEMLKRKRQAEQIAITYRHEFRPIHLVQQAFFQRPMPDETLCALLWEYKDRGKKGYDLTERFFALFRSLFPQLSLTGPERAGRDILLGEIFPAYPNPTRPVDFVIYDSTKSTVLAVGLARYDSDRGGAQEDDRTGGYRDCAREILEYTSIHAFPTKVIFLNDGPGLLLGSMWTDYARLEELSPGRIMITTARMIPERLTAEWLGVE